MVRKSILIVEDERDLADLLALNLEKEGFNSLITCDGASGLEAARTKSPDLILLDLMLPGIQGTEVCKLLKQDSKTKDIPIIMLTAKGEEIDQVVGFELGADDYISKPFSNRILMLRIKATLTRSMTSSIASKDNKIGPFIIDTDRRQVTLYNEQIELTPMEYNLLITLSENMGKVYSREHLLRTVWGYNYTGDTRTVNTYITKLRSKLGTAGNLIKTVRGFGYKLDEE
jgi:two-component system phosphate regulon response regulator PhoB